MKRELKDLERLTTVGEIRQWAEEIMQYIFTRSQENIIKNRSVDTGFMLRSGIPPYWDGDTIRIEYTAPWALFQEYGTKPHKMSGKYLVGWVQRKLGLKGKKAVSVAWAIATNISKNGLDQKPFLRPSINDAIVRYDLKLKPINI